MLNIETEFPHPGARAFLRPCATEVRIQRRNADGTALVSLRDRPRDASGTTTVALADLAPTAAAAVAPKRTRGRRIGA